MEFVTNAIVVFDSVNLVFFESHDICIPNQNNMHVVWVITGYHIAKSTSMQSHAYWARLYFFLS